jgi:methylglutaconyl-CoA hydratase
MSAKLVTERQGAVLEVRLNRPEVRNALDEELVAQLAEAFAAASHDDCRVVVFSGEGKSFCAGADIGYMQRLADFDHEDNVADAHRLSEAFLAISRCAKPVVAKVHGAAIGGAVGLVSACDVVIAAAGTKFGLSEVRLGILPAVISPFVLRRLGPATARTLFLTGERFGARRARKLGLVDSVASREEIDEVVRQTIESLLMGGPTAQAACKRLLDEIGPLPLAEAVTRTPEYIARQRATDEAKEGFAAFFEKRKPSWAPDA